MSDHQMHVTCLKLSQNTFGILIQARREEKETKSKKKTKKNKETDVIATLFFVHLLHKIYKK